MEYKKVFKIILISIIIGFSLNINYDTFKILSNNRLQLLKNEVKVLENKKQDILNSIEYKKTNTFVEEFARNELHMIKPNEDVYIAVKNGQSVLSSTTSTNILIPILSTKNTIKDTEQNINNGELIDKSDLSKSTFDRVFKNLDNNNFKKWMDLLF